MDSYVCWKVAILYESASFAPGNDLGQCFRYADPLDPYLGCPGNVRADQGASTLTDGYPYDPRTCLPYQPDCVDMALGADGARAYHHFYCLHGPPWNYYFDHVRPPTCWLTDKTGAAEGALVVNEMLTELILDTASFDTQPTPGTTDLPPGWPGYWQQNNGWAGYPTRIKLTYIPFPVGQRPDPESAPEFRYYVYNMRGDLIGGSVTHLESGEPVDLVYPVTSHGGETGDVMWDIGAIKIKAVNIKAITGIFFELPALGSQEVARVVIIGPHDTQYQIQANTSGGGINGVHTQAVNNIPVTVHLQIPESEFA